MNLPEGCGNFFIMSQPVRSLALFLALFAFSASVVEGVWASACAAMEMRAEMPAGMDMPMAGMGEEHSPDPPARHPDRSDDPECPLPTLAGSGCIVVSLHAPTLNVDLSTPDGRAAVGAPAELIDRIAVSNLFRPPRQ